jgi:hypothetical protein
MDASHCSIPEIASYTIERSHFGRGRRAALSTTSVGSTLAHRRGKTASWKDTSDKPITQLGDLLGLIEAPLGVVASKFRAAARHTVSVLR